MIAVRVHRAAGQRRPAANLKAVLGQPGMTHGAPVGMDYLVRAMGEFDPDACFFVFSDSPEDIGARRIPIDEIEADQRRLCAVEEWLRVFDPVTTALTAEAMELRQRLHGEAGEVYDRVKSSLPHVKALRDGLTDLVALLTGPAQLAADRRLQNSRVASDAVAEVLKGIDGKPDKLAAAPTTVTLTTTSAPPPPADGTSSKKRN